MEWLVSGMFIWAAYKELRGFLLFRLLTRSVKNAQLLTPNLSVVKKKHEKPSTRAKIFFNRWIIVQFIWQSQPKWNIFNKLNWLQNEEKWHRNIMYDDRWTENSFQILPWRFRLSTMLTISEIIVQEFGIWLFFFCGS